MEWLIDLKEAMSDCPCHSSIVQATYKGQPVFYLVASSIYCDQGSITLWDCNGTVIKEFRFVDKDMNNIEHNEVIYTCKISGE